MFRKVAFTMYPARAEIRLKAGNCIGDENMPPRTRIERTWLSLGSNALMTLVLSATAYQSGNASTIDPRPSDDPPAAQPLDPATGEDMLRRELAEVLSSGAEHMPEHLSRRMNPFSPGGGLFAAAPDSVVFTSARGGSAGGSSGHAAIRAAWSQVDAAWNARDAERFSRLFADDVSFRFVQRGQSLDGRTTIFEHFHEGFPSYAPDLRHRTRISTVHAIAPGVFTADGQVEILRLAAGGNAAPTVLRTFAIFAVMSGKEEDWIIRALRIYQLPTAADDTEAEGD